MGRGREKLDGGGGTSNVNSVFNTKLSKHIKKSLSMKLNLPPFIRVIYSVIKRERLTGYGGTYLQSHY